MTFLDYLAALLLSELPADYDPETDLCEPSPAHLPRIEERRRKVVDLHLDGGIDRAEMDRRVALLDEEAAKHRLVAAREKAAAAAEASAADPERRKALLKNVRAIRAAWARLPVEKRQNALAALAHRVEIGRSGVRFEWRSAVELERRMDGAARHHLTIAVDKRADTVG